MSRFLDFTDWIRSQGAELVWTADVSQGALDAYVLNGRLVLVHGLRGTVQVFTQAPSAGPGGDIEATKRAVREYANLPEHDGLQLEPGIGGI